MTSSLQTVGVDTDESVIRLTLNRPPLNVLNISMMTELCHALEGALGREDVSAILVRAEGKAFCAGVDVADHAPKKVGEMMRVFGRLFDMLLSTDIPIVAAVHGAALGGGMELICCSDIVLASDQAKFWQPEIKLAVFPPIAAAVLPRIMGPMRAMDTILTGRTLSATEALKAGLVEHVYPVAEFDDRVTEYMRQFALLSRPVLRLAKRVTSQECRGELKRRIGEAERAYMDVLMALQDPNEGIAAFLEKRAPQWKHA